MYPIAPSSKLFGDVFLPQWKPDFESTLLIPSTMGALRNCGKKGGEGGGGMKKKEAHRVRAPMEAGKSTYPTHGGSLDQPTSAAAVSSINRSRFAAFMYSARARTNPALLQAHMDNRLSNGGLISFLPLP